jgi:hypothetical protein
VIGTETAATSRVEVSSQLTVLADVSSLAGRINALIGSALACFDAAQLVWAAQPGSRLGPLVDEAMQAVADIG